MSKPVIVCPYDPRWPEAFARIRQELEAALGELITAIEHVGSTSVPGLAAKPIIDIDVVIPDASVFPEVVHRLHDIGYLHEGDLGIKDREAFRYESKPHLQQHHLYVCPQSSQELHRHITFREYLRNHPEEAKVYGAVKLEGARRYPSSIEEYMRHKSACIETLYRACGLQ